MTNNVYLFPHGSQYVPDDEELSIDASDTTENKKEKTLDEIESYQDLFHVLSDVMHHMTTMVEQCAYHVSLLETSLIGISKGMHSIGNTLVEIQICKECEESNCEKINI
jgi:hypothetical protein